jgi:hypothetical protein
MVKQRMPGARSLANATTALESSPPEIQHALFLQCPQVFLGRIGRLETQLAGNIGTCRRHPGFRDKVLNHLENLCLSGG